jgi:hypothetical protein
VFVLGDVPVRPGALLAAFPALTQSGVGVQGVDRLVLAGDGRGSAQSAERHRLPRRPGLTAFVHGVGGSVRTSIEMSQM